MFRLTLFLSATVAVVAVIGLGACTSDLTMGGGGSNGGANGAAGADAGPKYVKVTGCDPNAPDNFARDTDCDGLSDEEEYGATFGPNGSHTDPCLADTDGDGIQDGTELGRTAPVLASCTAFIPDVNPATQTDPTLADSDSDGLSDGQEDLNFDGKVDPGESDPLKVDSDCDGLTDLQERTGAFGCNSDPLLADSDSDGIADLVESGISVAPAPAAGCTASVTAVDLDPSTKTSACNPDTDGDGIMDGAEDLNHDGHVDANELNPLDASDGAGPAQNACATNKLRPIAFKDSGVADLNLALGPEFTQVSDLLDASGAKRGIIFAAPSLQIAGVALNVAPTGFTSTDEEITGRNKLAGLGSLTSPITQTFTSWDGYGSAVRATYDEGALDDVNTFVDRIAESYLGPNLGGALSTAGANGPLKVQAEFVRRSDKHAVALFAVVPASMWNGQRLFSLDDTAGGTAVAQFGDVSAVACEVFKTAGNPKVDFLWVVDDSCSMAAYQSAVGNAGSVFAQRLAQAGLDWRVGAVTTGFYGDPTLYRPFTTSVTTMQSWFTENSATWFGDTGNGYEMSLLSSRQYIQSYLLPRTAIPTENRVRQGADLHVILLGDADDQDFNPASSYTQFFDNFDGQGSKAVVHGIVCPAGQSCNESQGYPRRNLEVIAGTGGVLGDINVAQAGSPQLAQTLDAILSVAIAGTGHLLEKEPISSSIKVSLDPNSTVGACNTADVPRDNNNGYMFDAASGRVVLLGACLPKVPGTKVAVSYRYWIDNSHDPDGDACGGSCTGGYTCFVEGSGGPTCACKADCGGCATGQICDPNSCTCQVTIN